MTAAASPLVDAVELRRLLESDGAARPVVVLDASFDLVDPSAGERRFAGSHVPGSRYVHLDRDLCAAKTGGNGRHPLPDRAVFARTVGALGIEPGTRVVCLDAQGGAYAARLWWMLRWLGHADVAVLDGGLKAWQEAGGALVADAAADDAKPPSRDRPSFVADPVAHDAKPPYPDRPSLVGGVVDAEGVARRVPTDIVVDARSAERFRGEKEPIDPVAGRIPGALNRFHAGNLDERGRFKPAPVLRAELEALLAGRRPADVVHSCGSGVTACHNLLAMEHAGLAGSRLYPGSWSEWSSDPARPIARG